MRKNYNFVNISVDYIKYLYVCRSEQGRELFNERDNPYTRRHINDLTKSQVNASTVAGFYLGVRVFSRSKEIYMIGKQVQVEMITAACKTRKWVKSPLRDAKHGMRLFFNDVSAPEDLTVARKFVVDEDRIDSICSPMNFEKWQKGGCNEIYLAPFFQNPRNKATLKGIL